MRILIINNDMHPRQGGPPQVVAGHAAVLRRLGHELEVIATVGSSDEGAVRQRWQPLDEAGVPLHLFDRNVPQVIRRSTSLNRFVDQNMGRFDVVHIHSVWEHCLAYTAKAARRHRVPYVCSPHGMLDRWSRARSRFKKAISARILGTQAMLQGAAGAQFGSLEERDEAAELGMPWQSFIIPNGIDPDRFQRTPGEGRSELDAEFPQLRGRSPLFLFFSRMHPKKGVDLLLDAFAEIATHFPDAGLLVAAIAQDTEFEKNVRARATMADLRNRVAITTDYVGPRGKIAIHSADVFVLPSHQEGFSMAIIEAMAYGLPCLVTIPCHMGVISEIGAGFVVEPSRTGIEGGLRQALACDAAFLQQMGAAGSTWARRECSWDAIGQQLETMYNAVS